MDPLNYEAAARQLLRALRGRRSQAAFSRRLGFRSNVAAKWESGQRMPTAASVFGYSQVVGVDARAVLARFLPGATPALGTDGVDVGAWLRAVRGSQLLATAAEQSGLSRYSVSRFLSGKSEPRLPQYLALVDALTGRLEDLVDAWVGVGNVPLLASRFARSRAARDALFQRPLCLAVMCLLDTRPLQYPRARQIEILRQTLSCSKHLVEECLETLASGNVIQLRRGRYVLSGALTVDARSTPEEERAARTYWTQVAHERTLEPAADDLCSYNVFSIARSDLAKLRDLQRDFYRGARALIAASEPTDVAGLLVVQLVSWNPEAASDAAPP